MTRKYPKQKPPRRRWSWKRWAIVASLVMVVCVGIAGAVRPKPRAFDPRYRDRVVRMISDTFDVEVEDDELTIHAPTCNKYTIEIALGFASPTELIEAGFTKIQCPGLFGAAESW